METVNIKIEHEKENVAVAFGITKERFQNIFTSIAEDLRPKKEYSLKEYYYQVKQTVLIEKIIKRFNNKELSESEFIFLIYSIKDISSELSKLCALEAIHLGIE